MRSRVEQYLTRLPGRPTLTTEWVESPRALDAELYWHAYPKVLRASRWGAYLGGPLALILALMQFGPTSQERFLAGARNGSSLAWLADDLAFLIFSVIVALALLYTARHLPTPGRFPTCAGCGRHEETRHALAEERRKCRRCLVNVPFDRVVYPRRRTWRSL